MFRYATELKLRDTDAAGVAFFANYYAIAHEAYESFLCHLNRPLSSWLSEVHLPIVHSEADYKAPIRLSDPFEVLLSCERLGNRSFTLSYDFVSGDKLLAHLTTVHVAVASPPSEPKAISLPEELRVALAKLIKEKEVDASQ